MTIVVTGGAGFIGSNFVQEWLARSDEPVLNIDALTYAGNLHNLDALRGDGRHVFVHGDIADRALLARLLTEHQPRALIHFAAESHVDLSIRDPGEFIRTNVVGTFALLEVARTYWTALGDSARTRFRFVHVSTDEVHGSLDPDAPPFVETDPFAPSNPYAASKAASDHLVRAWQHTYGLPTVTTRCSNNYGPQQFVEKLIPLTIANALAGKSVSLYGDGRQVRDWLYVADHCSAVRAVLAAGRVGETYNVGATSERPNIEVVRDVCSLLDSWQPSPLGPYARLIKYVSDRPGHDRRYAIDASKIKSELGWRPVETLESGLLKTVRWYLDHADWVADVQSGNYRNWTEQDYLAR